MKKYLIPLFAFIFSISLLLPFQNVKAQDNGGAGGTEKVEYVLFHLDTCPHCQAEIKFLDKKVMPKYGQYINLTMYEVSDPKNSEIFSQYGTYYNVDVGGGVPVAFIDGETVIGYGSDKTTGEQIMQVVEEKLRAKGLIAPAGESEESGVTVDLPVVGEVNLTSFSLPVSALVLGLLDGFNPCAMWVLLFLISLLLGMSNKKKMWLLGSIFILISGLTYFVFMGAWLHFILFVGFIAIIRIAIGFLAIGVGFSNIKNWWNNRKADGLVCKVSSHEKTQKTFEKIKEIVHRENLLWSILGIVLLAFSVNLIEIACSAGFPALFTQILAINDIAMWQRYLYMAIYIFFYMLDDMIVFVLAMVTLQSTGISTKYAKQITFFSGILIFILGILLIVKPEWLMFN